MRESGDKRLGGSGYLADPLASSSWMSEVARYWPLAKGSISEVYKPCSNKSCKLCASGAKHRAYLFNYRLEGRTYCTYVPIEAVDTVQEALDNGRSLERSIVEEGLRLIRSYHKRRKRVGSPVASVSKPKGRLSVGLLSELDLLAPEVGYYRDFCGAIMRVVREQGMEPVLFNGTVRPSDVEREEADVITCPEVWSAAESRRVDAIICVCVPDTDAWRDRFSRLGMPVVGDPSPYRLSHAVGVIERGVQALHEMGATKVALLAWDHTDELLARFHHSASERGMRSEPAWVGGIYHPYRRGSGWEAFRDIWTARRDRPDGLLVTDDVLFREAAIAIAELGLGDRLQIVSVTNRAGSDFSVPFAHTRFEFDPQKDAEIMVAMLQDCLAGRPPPAQPVPSPFVVRSVTGPVKEADHPVGEPAEKVHSA